MLPRIKPLLLLCSSDLRFFLCFLRLTFLCARRRGTVSSSSPQASASSPTPVAAPVAAASPKITKPVVDQTAQIIIFCYHRLVDKIRYPGTEITPAAFEAEMKELKDRGITVISMQDLLAWKRGEKNIPPRSAVITFDDGWKSQYEVAWPIMKKYGYPFTMFIYTEGVRGGSSRRRRSNHLGTACRHAR